MCEKCEMEEKAITESIQAFTKELEAAKKAANDRFEALGAYGSLAGHTAKIDAALAEWNEWVKVGYPTDEGDDIQSDAYREKAKQRLAAKLDSMSLEDICYTQRLFAFFSQGMGLLAMAITRDLAGRVAKSIDLSKVATNTPAEMVA